MLTPTLTVFVTLLFSSCDAFLMLGQAKAGTETTPTKFLFQSDVRSIPCRSSTIITTGVTMKPIDSYSSRQFNSTKSLSSTTTIFQNQRQQRLDEADHIFDLVDVDKSNTVNFQELNDYFSTTAGEYVNNKVPLSYSLDSIQQIFSIMDVNENGEISRDEFRKHLVEEPTTQRDVDHIFTIVDVDGSGSIDLQELTEHLLSTGFEDKKEIERLFKKMDFDNNGKITRNEFRQAILDDTSNTNEDDVCPRGYFLNSVQQTYQKLSPIGRLSQRVETLGPFKRVYLAISNLFGVDTKKISKLGISFFLSYSIISNINTSISFSVAWYISCKRTGLSPLAPGQWRSLLAAYGMIYGLIQLLRPFRVAAAIGMSKLSAEYLELTQIKFNCSRSVSIGLQFISGQLIMGICAAMGITLASVLTGVKLL